MKRRGFLGALAVGIAALALPFGLDWALQPAGFLPVEDTADMVFDTVRVRLRNDVFEYAVLYNGSGELLDWQELDGPLKDGDGLTFRVDGFIVDRANRR